MRIILTGQPYSGPRFYGELSWRSTDVYVRHPDGRKDSRHSDGITYLSSDTTVRAVDTRVPTSAATQEVIKTIALPPLLAEPRALQGTIRDRDLVIDTASVGTAPTLAVSIVENSQLSDAIGAWQACSGVSSVQTFVDKGLGQSLLVALFRPSAHS